jgi:hypothetical protein
MLGISFVSKIHVFLLKLVLLVLDESLYIQPWSFIKKRLRKEGKVPWEISNSLAAIMQIRELG